MLLRSKVKKSHSLIMALLLITSIIVGPTGIKTASGEVTTTIQGSDLKLSGPGNKLVRDPIELLADMTAPTIDLSTLSASRTQAIPGDTVTIKVKAADDFSGVKDVAFELNNENGGYKLIIDTTADQEGYFKIDFPVTENTHYGQWYLNDLTVTDNNSNRTSYSTPDSDLSSADFTVDSAADVTAPNIDLSSLTVSRTSATSGDTVTIKVKASDDSSGVQNVAFELNNDSGSYVNVITDTKDAEGYYGMDFLVTENTHSGTWHLSYITVVDNNLNEISYSSNYMDLSAADFTVDTAADMTDPTLDLSTLSVSPTSAKAGDQVSLKVKASDDSSGVKNVVFELKNQNGGYYSGTDAAPDPEGYFQLDFPVTDNTHPGEWYLTYVTVADNNSNFKSYSDHNLDLSAADFFVRDLTVPFNLIDAEYVTGNTTWKYKTIDGDVYVGPDAILSIHNDVKINGNLYILGAVVSFGNLTVNEVHAHSISTDDSTPIHQGSFNARSGNQLIGSQVIADYPIPSIPIEIYSSNKVNAAGDLPLLEGATLPIADLYIDGVKTDYNYNGTFSIPNYNVGSKQSLEFKMVDVFGKAHYFTYILDQSVRLPAVITISGLNRFKTAVQVSQAAYPSAATAILVRSDDYPDALSAGPLAYALNAPILLTKSGELNVATEEELSRLGVNNIILLGGETAINSTVAAKLTGSGYNVSRISGANRFETAVAVAEKIGDQNGTPDSIILTSSLSFADSLSAGSYASREGYPILLTNGTLMSPVNETFLADHGITNIKIIGGSAVVSNDLEAQLKAAGFNVTRISGPDRSATSAILAAEFFPDPAQAIVASGWSFADALSAAPYAAKLNAPILLVTKDPINSSVENYLLNSDIYNIKVIGGESVITRAVKDSLLKIISK